MFGSSVAMLLPMILNEFIVAAAVLYLFFDGTHSIGSAVWSHHGPVSGGPCQFLRHFI